MGIPHYSQEWEGQGSGSRFIYILYRYSSEVASYVILATSHMSPVQPLEGLEIRTVSSNVSWVGARFNTGCGHYHTTVYHTDPDS